MAPTRRSLLRSFGGVVAVALAGCPAVDAPDSDGRSGHAPTPTRKVPGETAVSPPEPSATERSATALLPEGGDGWTRVTTERISASNLGGESGAVGEYESPGGVRFRAVALVMRPPYDAADKAERWACIGWDVTAVADGVAFAAGTGTEQRDYTPETPPHVDRTAIPGSVDRSRELLARSPLLSAERVDADEGGCES